MRTYKLEYVNIHSLIYMCVYINSNFIIQCVKTHAIPCPYLLLTRGDATVFVAKDVHIVFYECVYIYIYIYI